MPFFIAYPQTHGFSGCSRNARDGDRCFSLEGSYLKACTEPLEQELVRDVRAVPQFDVGTSVRMSMEYCKATPHDRITKLVRLQPGMSFRCRQCHFFETATSTKLASLQTQKQVAAQAFPLCLSAVARLVWRWRYLARYQRPKT